MLTIIGTMLAGIVAGYLLRGRNLKFLSPLLMVIVVLLLFLFGAEVGANDTVMDNLDTIGLQALVITLGALLGSVALAWVVYKYFFLNKTSDNEK